MRGPTPWRTTPPITRIIFLAAVFCTFAGIGFASDVIGMGSQSLPRFAISVPLIGLFAIFYAAGGVILRNRFWIVFFPILILQFVCMGLLSARFPDAPQPTQLNAAETRHLRARMAFDGVAATMTVCLGYAGLVYVAVSEARRYGRSQTEKAMLESEMAAAREVQRVMVPEDLPSIPGYLVESVYRPAAEVGGDFFQVVPLQSGRTLVVIGDVSGKGLRAAMIVSMIVGMLRTVSGFTEEPAEILGELNRRLCGRTYGGFVTSLIVRLESQGRLTLANAGHPAPYLNGIEVPSPGSMPLGLIELIEYGQSTLETRIGDRVLLLTDGVPEARDQHGSLLGFPRVESLLQEGASVLTVAEISQQHGQEDDLTVIGILRQS